MRIKKPFIWFLILVFLVPPSASAFHDQTLSAYQTPAGLSLQGTEPLIKKIDESVTLPLSLKYMKEWTVIRIGTYSYGIRTSDLTQSLENLYQLGIRFYPASSEEKIFSSQPVENPLINEILWIFTNFLLIGYVSSRTATSRKYFDINLTVDYADTNIKVFLGDESFVLDKGSGDILSSERGEFKTGIENDMQRARITFLPLLPFIFNPELHQEALEIIQADLLSFVRVYSKIFKGVFSEKAKKVERSGNKNKPLLHRAGRDFELYLGFEKLQNQDLFILQFGEMYFGFDKKYFFSFVQGDFSFPIFQYAKNENRYFQGQPIDGPLKFIVSSIGLNFVAAIQGKHPKKSAVRAYELLRVRFRNSSIELSYLGIEGRIDPRTLKVEFETKYGMREDPILQKKELTVLQVPGIANTLFPQFSLLPLLFHPEFQDEMLEILKSSESLVPVYDAIYGGFPSPEAEGERLLLHSA